MKKPRVSIIVLNWNGKKDTLRCLNSLKKLTYDNYEVIVVDNNSHDGSVTAIKNAFPDFPLIVNDRNYGYAEGNNIGIRCALKKHPDYLFILNNDTVVDPHCLDELLAVSQSYPRGGIFGTKTYLMDDRKKLYLVGLDFNPITGHVSYTGMNEIDYGRYENIQEFDIINGHAFLIKRKVIETIGLFDKDYFAYNEETDYSLRASKAGFKMVYVPRAIVFHRGEGSPAGTLRQYLIKRNHLLCMKKNAPPANLFLFYLYFFLIDLPLQIARHVLKKQWGLIPVAFKAIAWNFGFGKKNAFERIIS